MFEEGYFQNRHYTHKEQVVKRHVLEVLGWASKPCGINLLDGQGKRALDVGCACGYTSSALCDLGYNVCGIDISRWGIKQAKTLTGNQFIVCDAQEALPFLTESFDLVTCFDVLEHLPSPEKALLGLFAASKGTLVCTTPNKKVEKPIRKLTGDFDETHINVKSANDWTQIMASLGGKLKVDTYFDWPFKWRGKLFFKSVRIPTYGLTVRIVVWK